MKTNDKVTSKQTVYKQTGEMSEKVILSLDCATKTGYAIWRNGVIVASGTKRFSHQETKRIKGYSEWLQSILAEWQVTNIIAEDIYRETSKQRDSAFFEIGRASCRERV